MTFSRRQLIGGAGALFLLNGCKTAHEQPAPNRIDKIGIQTYTLREAMGKDDIATFQMIKDVGYDYVELNRRDFSSRPPAELRRILDRIGLPSPITHVDYDSLANRTSELADTAATLGCEYVVLPWIDDDQRASDDYKAHAEMLNKAGEQLAASGIRVAYHNHQFEFFDLGGGQNGMDILLTETEASLVDFELDLFWAALAGSDIVSLFNQHTGRFKLCHIKDLAGDASPWTASVDFAKIVDALMVNVGEGQLPFETYFAANDVSGMKYFIAEHDNPPKPFRASIETSYNNIRNMRF
jgi:sugar phosphate isomerase/epimerase